MSTDRIGLHSVLLPLLITVKTITKLNMEIRKNWKRKFQKLSVVIHVLQTTQNLVISRCCFAENGKKCTKNYNTPAQPLPCSLRLPYTFRGVSRPNRITKYGVIAEKSLLEKKILRNNKFADTFFVYMSN